MLTREDVEEKLKSGELTPQDIAANGSVEKVGVEARSARAGRPS